MIPLCLDEGVGIILWSRLARGRLARAGDDAKATRRAETDDAYADLLYRRATQRADRAIVDAVGSVAEAERAFEAPPTPRYDFQGVSDEAELEAIRSRVPGFAPA